MRNLATQAELVKLARILQTETGELEHLDYLEAERLRTLREGITEALQDGDYSFNDDAPAEFVLKISRHGTGLDTIDSDLPKPSKVSKTETEAMAEVREMNVASFTEVSHPFIKPAAEFTSEDADAES